MIAIAVVACMISGGLGAIAGAWGMYRFMRNDFAQQRSPESGK